MCRIAKPVSAGNTTKRLVFARSGNSKLSLLSVLMFTGALRASARILPDYPSRAIRASAELKGLVVQSDNGAPIADAAVSLPLVNRHARTDSLGQFVFANIPATTQPIEIRKLGFEVLRDSVTAADLSAVRRYALVPSPQALDTVRTNATNPDFLSPSLKAFEQ